jgi:hypothetical protein
VTGTFDGLAGHRGAVERFVASARTISPDRWAEPVSPGKWSPAEIAEHLSLTYDRILAELNGGPPVRVKVKGFKLLLLRLTVMPRFLGAGYVPPGVRAPREILPVAANPDRAQSLARFEERAAEFERVMAERLPMGKLRVTHPFFGRLTLVQGVRFVEVHLRHHTKQLPSA